MTRLILMALSTAILAACGGDDETAGTGNADASSSLASNATPASRAALVEACVENSENGESACACAAEKVETDLDGDVYDFFVARLAGEDADADAVMAKLSLTDLQQIGETMQSVILQCGLQPIR